MGNVSPDNFSSTRRLYSYIIFILTFCRNTRISALSKGEVWTAMRYAVTPDAEAACQSLEMSSNHRVGLR